MYRHAWESVLSYCPTLADLSRASKINHLTLDASRHMKPACFEIEYTMEKLEKQIPYNSTQQVSAARMLRHVSCMLRVKERHNIPDTVLAATQRGMVIRGLDIHSIELVNPCLLSLATNEFSTIMTTITSLNLNDNHIGPIGIGSLTSLLSKNVHITSINLSDNPLGDEGAVLLTKILERNTYLTLLDLHNCRIGSAGIAALMVWFQASTPVLKEIDLSFNEIYDEDVLTISGVLQTNTSLTWIDIGGNHIGDRGAIALSRVLQTNTSMTYLGLQCNYIGTEGVVALSNFLKVNTHLVAIKLGSNRFGSDGAIALADALKINPSITHITLSSNQIDDRGILALAKALLSNTCLTNMYIGMNNMTKKGVDALTHALATNTHVMYMDLTYNQFDVSSEDQKSLSALFDALYRNRTCAGS